MWFDKLGLPVEDNASDKQDSARLAGLCVLFGFKDVDLRKYLISEPSGRAIYVRHPKEKIYDFSRDQAICLIAGYATSMAYHHYISKFYIQGKDFISPSVEGHIRRCMDLKASLWQDLWLKADMWSHAKFTPLSESNQILAMCKVAGPKWLKTYCKWNPKWRESLEIYWVTSRAKPEIEFCAHIIKNIEEDLAK